MLASASQHLESHLNHFGIPLAIQTEIIPL